eukprot:Lankesteria_metandrocarpae@DN4208_c0_g1_i1.p1
MAATARLVHLRRSNGGNINSSEHYIEVLLELNLFSVKRSYLRFGGWSVVLRLVAVVCSLIKLPTICHCDNLQSILTAADSEHDITYASLSNAFAQRREDGIFARKVGPTGTDMNGIKFPSLLLRVTDRGSIDTARSTVGANGGDGGRNLLKNDSDDHSGPSASASRDSNAHSRGGVASVGVRRWGGRRVLSGSALGSFSAGGHRTYGYGPPAAFKSIKWWEDIDTELRWPYPPTKFQKRKPIPNWNKKAYAPPMDSNNIP